MFIGRCVLVVVAMNIAGTDLRLGSSRISAMAIEKSPDRGELELSGHEITTR